MLVNWLGGTLVTVIRGFTNARIDRNVRRNVWQKFLTFPMSAFKTESPRESVSRITTDTSSVSALFVMALIPLLVQLYSTWAILNAIASYNPKLTLTLLVVLPLILIVSRILGKLLFQSTRKIAKVRASLTMRLSEMIVSIPIVRLFAQEKKEAAKGADVSQQLYQIELKVSWIDLIGNLILDLVLLIQVIVLLVIGRWLLKNEEITTRAWVVFFLFSGKVTNNIQDLVMIWKNAKTIQGSTARIAEMMRMESEEDNVQMDFSLTGDIALQEVTFAYHPETPLLSNVSCRFPEGKISALIGVSGRGKSTLFHLITRLYEPQQGEIYVGETPISTAPLSQFRRQFIVLSQHPVLFSGTIEENLRYGLTYVPTQEQMNKALKEAQADFVFALSEGVDTWIGEYGETLSGGERQRLVIARALLADARYWLLDEAFSAMDTQATTEILAIIRRVAQNRTVVMIAHTPIVLSIVDHVVVLEQDKIQEGSIEKLRKTSQYFQDFVAGKKGGTDNAR